MRISITVVAADTAISNDFIPLEVFPEMTLDDVKGFVEAEINIPPSAQNYILNDQIVTQTTHSLVDLGINEGDVLSLAVRTKPQDAARAGNTAGTNSRPLQQQTQNRSRPGPDPEILRLQLLNNRNLMAEVQQEDPELASAVQDQARFAQVFSNRLRQRDAAQREREEMIARLDADPFNIEAQQKIEEMIRQERVMENMQKAYEENPESFGHVTMLYIDVTVNGFPIKAFVDSGAQTTIMSPAAAERCGIMRLIDRRFSGIARGVGTAQILGRVHSADIQIGQYNLASSFTVMEGKDVDLLLGLDMLKRHQMCIDLKDNCLRVADDKVSFLPESEIPKMQEGKRSEEQKVAGPGGTTIGTESGTVERGPSSKTPISNTSVVQPTSSGSRITIHPQGADGNVNTPRQPISTASQPSTQQQNAPSPFGATAPITERSISQITELGFSREEAVAALQQVGGNVELAIGLLL